MYQIVYNTQTGEILANPCDKQDGKIVATNYQNAAVILSQEPIDILWNYCVNLETLEVERKV